MSRLRDVLSAYELANPTASHRGNYLLAMMSAADLALLQPLLEATTLPLRQALEEPNTPIQYAHFPNSGLASIVAHSVRNGDVEAGVIGREGMTGVPLLLGDDRSPHSTFMQLAGEGYRIGADDLREAMRESPTLHAFLLRFAHALLVQVTHTVLVNGRANIEQRLARWLLMAHDRNDGDEIALTHDFLSLMLGVRRAGVTVALQILEGKALISSTRGLILVQDRGGLEDLAGDLYGVPESEYRRLTGWRPKRRPVKALAES